MSSGRLINRENVTTVFKMKTRHIHLKRKQNVHYLGKSARFIPCLYENHTTINKLATLSTGGKKRLLMKTSLN